MELGEKVKKARLEAGLSQRQLCGEEITRNMLSQIEHGTARPSMDTLTYLASRLDKPVSWFLDARAEANSVLLESVGLLQKAEEAIDQGKDIYASELLEKVSEPNPDVQRRKFLLSARIPGADLAEICENLPSLDEELLLRAKAALEQDDFIRCEHLLEAMEDHCRSGWYMTRGELNLRQRKYSAAAECFHRAEVAYPEEATRKLEQCYRELGDYKMAYEYAVRQKR